VSLIGQMACCSQAKVSKMKHPDYFAGRILITSVRKANRKTIWPEKEELERFLLPQMEVIIINRRDCLSGTSDGRRFFQISSLCNLKYNIEIW